MKLTKKIVFLFSFLFITWLINGKNQFPGNNSVTQKVQGATQDQDQLQLTKSNLAFCFRLTENTNPCFRNSEKANSFFYTSFKKQLLFSKQLYRFYVISRFNHLDNYPLYLRHRRFRIWFFNFLFWIVVLFVVCIMGHFVQKNKPRRIIFNRCTCIILLTKNWNN